MNKQFSIINLCLISLVSFTPNAIARPLKVQQRYISQNNVDFTSLFKPPTEKGQPKRTFGGAIRGDSCSLDQEQSQGMTPLIASVNSAKTTKAKPEFLAYIPPLDGTKKAILTIKDETEDYYHRETIEINRNNTIVPISAVTAPELEIGTKYNLYLKIICNDVEDITDPETQLTMTRVVEPSIELTDKIKAVEYYSQNGIWFDALDTAYNLREKNSIYWQNLLQTTSQEQFINLE